jgi:hypothetical protein
VFCCFCFGSCYSPNQTAQVLFETEEYEILYEDDRDGDVDRLSPQEVEQLEREFDAMGMSLI